LDKYHITKHDICNNDTVPAGYTYEDELVLKYKNGRNLGYRG